MTQHRWRRLTGWPLAVRSLLFLVIYAYEVIWNLDDADAAGPDAVLTAVRVAFAIDFAVDLALADHRRTWFVRHSWELAIVALPILRPLRLLRLLRLLSFVVLLQRSTVAALRGRVAISVACGTGLLVLVAGIAVLDAEQDARGANIVAIGDAWWWAFATITTVGYGDFSPITLAGRLVAVVLMGCGVALLSSVTALLASWLVEQVGTTQRSRS